MKRAICLWLLLAAGAHAGARPDGVETVKEKLFQAKKEYDGEAQKYRRGVSEALEKREAAARKAGDKKALDAVKIERERFDKGGELPSVVPPALTAQMKAARTKLDKAYATAVKELVKQKEDAAAEAVEKEFAQFQTDAAIQFGKRSPLAKLKAFDVKGENATSFKADFSVALKGETVPNCVFLHPPARGSSVASFPLGAKYLALQTSVGIPQSADAGAKVAAPLTFEIVGDGKVLWTSEPVTEFDKVQTVQVSVTGVKTLTLRTTCAGHNAWAQAHWLQPLLIE